ncbi:MAG: hypothetical protein Q8O53_00730 [Candidatus Moranbacteria bacterium]|nr:hypothetical protein [Candidatus Moranbacteria bacterium]
MRSPAFKTLLMIPVLLAVFFAWGLLSPFQSTRSFFSKPSFFMTAVAENDNEEAGEENGDDSPASLLKGVPVTAVNTTYVPVKETVTMTPVVYQNDTDGDGVPNALDQHHDEDDFTYFESETDDNYNGIIDSYEQP